MNLLLSACFLLLDSPVLVGMEFLLVLVRLWLSELDIHLLWVFRAGCGVYGPP